MCSVFCFVCLILAKRKRVKEMSHAIAQTGSFVRLVSSCWFLKRGTSHKNCSLSPETLPSLGYPPPSSHTCVTLGSEKRTYLSAASRSYCPTRRSGAVCRAERLETRERNRGPSVRVLNRSSAYQWRTKTLCFFQHSTHLFPCIGTV